MAFVTLIPFGDIADGIFIKNLQTIWDYIIDIVRTIIFKSNPEGDIADGIVHKKIMDYHN